MDAIPLPNILSNPQFRTAAHSPRQWPPDEGLEIAFAGRSNVGKSSAINAITRRKSLARTSRTPGRTQQIMFFELPGGRHLVDLPGYGYAQVPEKLRRHWGEAIETYLRERESLQGLLLLMDARHPLTKLDRQMLSWCTASDLRVHILLTKFDKLSRSRGTSALRLVEKETSLFPAVSVQAFSALDSTGLSEARRQIVEWLGAEPVDSGPVLQKIKSPGTKGGSGSGA